MTRSSCAKAGGQVAAVSIRVRVSRVQVEGHGFRPWERSAGRLKHILNRVKSPCEPFLGTVRYIGFDIRAAGGNSCRWRETA